MCAFKVFHRVLGVLLFPSNDKYAFWAFRVVALVSPLSICCCRLSGAAVTVEVTLRGDERGVRRHLVDVDVGGVEEDVVLSAEAGEDGGDAGHQLGEGGAALGFGVPALDHHIVSWMERSAQNYFSKLK